MIQQDAQLQQMRCPKPHPICYHFTNDLLEFVKQCPSNSELVIVNWDINEKLGIQSCLPSMCSEYNLQDIFLAKHGQKHFATDWI